MYRTNFGLIRHIIVASSHRLMQSKKRFTDRYTVTVHVAMYIYIYLRSYQLASATSKNIGTLYLDGT